MKYTIFKYSATVIILLTIVLWHHHFSFAQSPVMSIQDLLRFRIESGGAPLKITVGTEPIHAAIVLPIFYESRVYQPAWTNSQGFLPKAEALLNEMLAADPASPQLFNQLAGIYAKREDYRGLADLYKRGIETVRKADKLSAASRATTSTASRSVPRAAGDGVPGRA